MGPDFRRGDRGLSGRPRLFRRMAGKAPKIPITVIPAKAGIHQVSASGRRCSRGRALMGPDFRRGDGGFSGRPRLFRRMAGKAPKIPITVIPAKAGIHQVSASGRRCSRGRALMGPDFRRGDGGFSGRPRLFRRMAGNAPKIPITVIPAKAGTHWIGASGQRCSRGEAFMGPDFRRGDGMFSDRTRLRKPWNPLHICAIWPRGTRKQVSFRLYPSNMDERYFAVLW